MQQKFAHINLGAAGFTLWRNAFIAGAFTSGCAWGALSLFLFPADSILHQAYLTFILGGICAGAVSSYAPQPGAFPAFCVSVLTPYATAIWMTDVPESNLLAALVLAFMIIMLRAAQHARTNVQDVLDLQVRNSNLTRALHHRATHDSLVDLVNHGEFNRRLKRIAASDRREGGEYSMIFIDLDLFKEVNDTGGHAAGDEVLKSVAQVLKRSSRGGDTAARVGGDEFALLLEGCPGKRAKQIGEHIRREIAELRVLHEGEYYGVEASVGIAYGRAGVHSAESMLKAADAACYAAKERGRNQVVAHSASDLFETTDRFEIAQATANGL
jgi:diguanylate cyclase (GGDEF)-like protein